MTAMESLIGTQSENPLVYVFKLLHLRWVIFTSGFKRAKPLQKALTIALWLLIMAVIAGTYLLSDYILEQLNSPVLIQSGINLTEFIEAIPALMIVGIFLLTLIASFRLLLQALYLARDMDFLVSAPIPIRSVFLAKLLEAILPTFILVLVFGLPVLISLGARAGFHLIYYPLVFIVIACIAIAAAGIASLLVMAVVRIFPAKRVAEILTFLGAFFIIAISQTFNLAGNKLESLSPEQVLAGSQLFSKLNSPWVPLAWGGRGLVDLGQERWISGCLFLVLTIALSSVVFWVALNTAERLYYTGWASLRVGTRSKKNHRVTEGRENGSASSIIFLNILPAEVGAIIRKDFKQVRRDLNNLSQVIGALIMGIVLGVMLLRGGGEPLTGQGDAPSQFMLILRSGMVYGSMVIGLFVGWALLSRLALVAFSMEGRSYWILKTAPVSAGKLLAAKFLMAFLPSLILSWFYLLGIALLQKAPLATILYGIPSITLILAGLCGINLALGVRGANLTWTDPRKMENGVAGILGTIISIVYQLVTLVLFFGIPLGFPLLGISPGIGMSAGILIGGAVALLCTFLPLSMVKGRVCRIGEE